MIDLQILIRQTSLHKNLIFVLTIAMHDLVGYRY